MPMKSAVQRFVFIFLVGFISAFNVPAQQTSSVPQGWDTVPALLKRIVPPTFPRKDFDVQKFGAIADGKTDCSKAFKKAIEKCNETGGGNVVEPKGVYLTGSISLKSNVNLFISKDAIIKFSTDPIMNLLTNTIKEKS